MLVEQLHVHKDLIRCKFAETCEYAEFCEVILCSCMFLNTAVQSSQPLPKLSYTELRIISVPFSHTMP